MTIVQELVALRGTTTEKLQLAEGDLEAARFVMDSAEGKVLTGRLKALVLENKQLGEQVRALLRGYIRSAHKRSCRKRH